MFFYVQMYLSFTLFSSALKYYLYTYTLISPYGIEE